MYFEKMIFFNISPYKCIGTQIWSCRKKVKGQSTIIIWSNLADFARVSDAINQDPALKLS